MNTIDYLYCDYDELSTSERMAATAAAREAARGWRHKLDDSAWMALGDDDPRQVAFESEFKKCNS